MSLSEKLLAAALSGAVLGAVGCGASTSQTQPTTPETAAAGDKHQCKGEHSCGGQHGCKGEHSCGGKAKAEGEAGAATQSADGTGEKASCKAQGSCHS